MSDTSSPADALAGVRAINDQIARKVECPPQYHLAFGLLMGAMVAGQALSPLGACVVLVICMGFLGLMFMWQRRRLGVFVNGYRRGRTRSVALTLLVIVEALLFGSIWLKHQGLPWAPLAAAALVVPIAIAGSYIWQAAYRTDLARAAQ
jgi:phosphatidylglycerophosphate synthase